MKAHPSLADAVLGDLTIGQLELSPLSLGDAQAGEDASGNGKVGGAGTGQGIYPNEPPAGQVSYFQGDLEGSQLNFPKVAAFGREFG